MGTGPYSPTCVTTVRGTRGTDPRPSTALKGRRVKEKKSVKRRMRGVDSEGEGFGEGEREIKRLGGLEESFEEEAERLGESAKFMKFLAKRAKKPAIMSLGELKQRIDHSAG